MERDLSSQKRPILRPLFKVTSFDGKSMEDLSNFPKVPGVIICISDTCRVLKVWDHFQRLMLVRCLATLLPRENVSKNG